MRPNEARFCALSATALNCATLFPNLHFGNLEQIRRTPSYCLAVCFRAWGLLCIVHLHLFKSLPGRIQRMLFLNRLATFRRSDYMAHHIVSPSFCQLQGALHIPIGIHGDPCGRESRANSRHETPFKNDTEVLAQAWAMFIPRTNVALWIAPKHF